MVATKETVKKIIELDNEVQAAWEDGDPEVLDLLKEAVKNICDKYPNDKYAMALKKNFEEAKYDAELLDKFEETKDLMKKAYLDWGMDEDEAEEEADYFAYNAMTDKINNKNILLDYFK